jgi:hypothetical protein
MGTPSSTGSKKPMRSDSSAMPAERPARADRN